MQIIIDDGRTKYEINIEEDTGHDGNFLNVSITTDDQQTFKGKLYEK